MLMLIHCQRVFSGFPYAPSEPFRIDDADATLKLVLNIDFIDCKKEVYLAALKIVLMVKSASAGFSNVVFIPWFYWSSILCWGDRADVAKTSCPQRLC